MVERFWGLKDIIDLCKNHPGKVAQLVFNGVDHGSCSGATSLPLVPTTSTSMSRTSRQRISPMHTSSSSRRPHASLHHFPMAFPACSSIPSIDRRLTVDLPLDHDDDVRLHESIDAPMKTRGTHAHTVTITCHNHLSGCQKHCTAVVVGTVGTVGTCRVVSGWSLGKMVCVDLTG